MGSSLGHPAFVLSLYDTGLCTAKVLSQLGISVVGFDYNPRSPGFYSKSGRMLLSPPPDRDQELLQLLVSEAQKYSLKPILFPASDAFVAFVGRNENKLRENFEFILPEKSILENILSKHKQGHFAKSCGASVPHSVLLENNDSLIKLEKELRFPLYLKPEDNYVWQKHFKTKGFLVRNKENLQNLWTQIQRLGMSVVVQESIPGDITKNFEISGYITKDGKVFGPFIMQKIRHFPLDLGTGTLGKSIIDPELARMAQDLWTRMQLRGFVNSEFKWDSRDKTYKYIETNVRVWQQLELATVCGLNLPLVQYLDLTGQKITEANIYQEGVYWIDPLRDFFAAAAEYRKGKSDKISVLSALINAKARGIFSQNDIWPGLRSYVLNRTVPAALFYSVKSWAAKTGQKFNATYFKFLVKKMAFLSGLPQFLAGKRSGYLYIFNYHRVKEHAEDQSQFDDGSFSVDGKMFRKQMLYLKNNFQILSEDQLRRHLSGTLKLDQSKSYAMVTFDDGYIDNYTVALPILKELKVPATFFIPTKIFSERKLGWWDIIAYLVKHSAKDRFVFQGKEYSALEEAQTIRKVTALLRESSEAEVNTFLIELQEATGSVWPSENVQDQELMSWAQLREALTSGINIGSHAHSHKILSKMSLNQQAEELSVSKSILESELGVAINSFAYPVGQYTHFNAETKNLLLNAGYEIAYSFMTGTAKGNQLDVFDVQRVYAPSDMESFILGCAFPEIFFRNHSEVSAPLPAAGFTEAFSLSGP